MHYIFLCLVIVETWRLFRIALHNSIVKAHPNIKVGKWDSLPNKLVKRVTWNYISTTIW